VPELVGVHIADVCGCESDRKGHSLGASSPFAYDAVNMLAKRVGSKYQEPERAADGLFADVWLPVQSNLVVLNSLNQKTRIRVASRAYSYYSALVTHSVILANNQQLQLVAKKLQINESKLF
jgi:hypothetical protein